MPLFKKSEKKTKEKGSNELSLYTHARKSSGEQKLLGDNKPIKVSDETFETLSNLLEKPVEEIKDECVRYELNKLIGKLCMTMVKNNMGDKEIRADFCDCKQLGINEILVTPQYLDVCGKVVRKLNLESIDVYSVIDFPFGNGDTKSRMYSIKQSIKAGVDGIALTMSETSDYKAFKKEVKKGVRKSEGNLFVAVNASETSVEELKVIVKSVEKTKAQGYILMFGNGDGFESKIKTVVDNSKKKVKVLGNIKKLDDALQLFHLKIDTLLTPYAIDIGIEVLNKFKLKK